MLKNVYGIDVGNYDTKSALECTSSAYTELSTLPLWEDEYLNYNGMYYIPSASRPAIVKDKTSENAKDREIILALMAIGKETLARLEKKNITDKAEKQDAISKIKRINIAVGLPPRYMSKEKAMQTENYYHEKMDKGIQFEYSGYSFDFSLQNVMVYPQGLLPTILNAPKSIKDEYSSYYGIDIGGFTVDVVFINNGKADFEKTVTLEKGVLPLYEKIIDRVMIEQDVTLEQINIEDVLNNKKHILDENVVSIILECRGEWVNDIINTLTQKKINLKTFPSCWSGGGSLLFRPCIDANPNVAKAHDYITDVRANAKCYQNMMQAMNS